MCLLLQLVKMTEYITGSAKTGDSSKEEPNSLVTKKPATGSPASGQDGIHAPDGTGRGDLSEISTFCPNPPKRGWQGSNGRDRSSIQPANCEKKKKNNTLPKPLHHSKSRTIENSNSYVLPHNYIIRWNCRGLRSNRKDMELLVLIYSPPAICLKETLLKRDQTQTFKRYSAYYKNGIHGHTGQIKSSLFLSWYMYNNINTQSYSVPWEGEPVKQCLSSWYPGKKRNKTHAHAQTEKDIKNTNP